MATDVDAVHHQREFACESNAEKDIKLHRSDTSIRGLVSSQC